MTKIRTLHAPQEELPEDEPGLKQDPQSSTDLPPAHARSAAQHAARAAVEISESDEEEEPFDNMPI